jgi:hypothetical protein
MAKIYSFSTKELLIDLPAFEFIPIPDSLLNGKSCLTIKEMKLIEDSLVESDAIRDQCTDSEMDVYYFHQQYIAKLIERLEISLIAQRSKKKSKKTRNFISSNIG